MQSYPIPAASISISEEIKKSRFITFLAPTCGISAARAFIHKIRDTHPAARHYCWAFVAGAPSDSQQLGFSDDGEPSGTAGKPILAQLTGRGIGEVTAVVVRYYGGVKLGTGGLVKAYGGGVRQALEQLVISYRVPQIEYTLQCDYAQLMSIEHLLKEVNGHILQAEYGSDVMLRLALPVLSLALFMDKLRDFSRGSLQPVVAN